MYKNNELNIPVKWFVSKIFNSWPYLLLTTNKDKTHQSSTSVISTHVIVSLFLPLDIFYLVIPRKELNTVRQQVFKMIFTVNFEFNSVLNFFYIYLDWWLISQSLHKMLLDNICKINLNVWYAKRSRRQLNISSVCCFCFFWIYCFCTVFSIFSCVVNIKVW